MLAGAKAIGTVGFMAGVPAMLRPFWRSCIDMVQYNAEIFCQEGQYVHYADAPFSDHAPARNSLVQQMLGDWLVQLDCDHEFEPDLVARLVNWADQGECEVLVGFYQYKSAPHSPVLYLWDEETGLPAPVATWDREADLFRVGSAGGGCLFVRRSVFDRMKEECAEEQPFDRIAPMSEDHSFFKRCASLEIPVWCCPHIQAPHLAFRPITQDDFDAEAVVSQPREVEGLAQ